MLRRGIGAAAVALACALPASASAQLTTTSSSDLTPRVKEYVGTSVALNGTTRLRVILPTGYAENPTRRYPVLYLLHGAFDDYRSWVDKGAAENASEPYQMIVVMPDGGTVRLVREPRQQRPALGELPHRRADPVGGRDVPDQAGAVSERAIAGLSMGGHGTAAYSGRHPDLFAAAEAFSGVVNPLALGPGENVFGPKTPANIARWEGSDGTYLIPNYRTYAHFGLRTGNGQPGPFDAPTRPVDTLEAALHGQNTIMHNRLTAAGIPHVWEEGPGTHTWPYWERSLRRALPEFQRVFDGDVPTPAQVNFRLPDNTINAWGWTIAFDAARQPAWTTLAGADATGFTLTGTGAATVTTPPLFPAGKAYKAAGVTVTAGARRPADDPGRPRHGQHGAGVHRRAQQRLPGHGRRHGAGHAQPDARRSGHVRRVHARRRAGVHGVDDRDRHEHRRRRGAERLRPRPPDQRRLLPPPAAAGGDREERVDGAGVR